MFENYEFLRDCYLDLQQASVYPFVNKMELSVFCERAKLVDEKINTAACDLLFVSSNQAMRPGIKNKTGLIRGEFLEFVVRLAKFKYLDPPHGSGGPAKSFRDAVDQVLNKFIKKNYNPQSWQGFRTNELWTIDVNDVFDVNLEGVHKLHNFYFSAVQKYMSSKNAISLLTSDANADLTHP